MDHASPVSSKLIKSPNRNWFRIRSKSSFRLLISIMRLLSTRAFLGLEADRPILEEFVASLPRYAILCHTWETGEYLFEDIESGSGRDKKGYQKVKKCCEVALSDGFDYAWVDTCAINKSSSSELSESINSMFEWYKSSAVCYTYLFDVELSDDQDSLSKSQLTGCRWITRGWTLQELIAPDTVKFYDKHWNECGDRNQLAPLLQQITRIDLEVLRREPGSNELTAIHSYSISKRMSWASTRQTTRPEDQAYSVLGIFQVNMAMQYGEGGTRAFYRLQEEIMKQSTDQTIFCWSPLEENESMTSSILADSPSAFRNGSQIVPIAHQDTFEMTNRGLRTTTRLIEYSPSFSGLKTSLGSFSLLLNCVDTSEFAVGQLSIRVKETENEDVFTRVALSPYRIPVKYLQLASNSRISKLQLLESLQSLSTSRAIITAEDTIKENRETNPYEKALAISETALAKTQDLRHAVIELERSVRTKESEVIDRLNTLQRYLAGTPRTIYITHLANKLRGEATGIAHCYFKPLRVSWRDGRSEFEVRYLYSGHSDSAKATRTRFYEDGEHEFKLTSIQVVEAFISELRASELRPFISPCSIVLTRSSADTSRLEIVNISCRCGKYCKFRTTAEGYGTLECDKYNLRVTVSIARRVYSGRRYNIVEISIYVLGEIIDDERGLLTKIWDYFQGQR